MSRRNRIRALASGLYVAALVIGIFTGSFVWIAIGGALMLVLVYNSLRGGAAGMGRQRNRNRNRDRS